MTKCLYCQDEIPEGMMVCPTCLNNLTPSGDCRKCLHFDYCTDKGNHAYRGCGYCIDKDEYARVVRCGKCQHWEMVYTSGMLRQFGYCKKCKLDTPSDHFCAYGEKAGKQQC